MAKKKLSEEQLKEIKLLQASNEMLEKTKEEAKLRGTQNAVKRIEIAQQDVISQIAQIDEDIAQETVNDSKNVMKSTVSNEIKLKESANQSATVYDAIEKMKDKKENKSTSTESVVEVQKSKAKSKVKVNNNIFSKIPSDVQYDVISLPSNGECYGSKLGRIPVGYLTASDENFLTSPNLYQDGLVIDFLLNNKILDDTFDVDNMCSGDADAVILFLRATSYGADFPISVRDPETKERFDTVVDLTTFKNKDFKLIGDEDGYFSYTLPLSKDEIKFKYLSRKEEKELELLSDIERKNGKSTSLRGIVGRLTTILREDDKLSAVERNDIDQSIKKIIEWADKSSEEDGIIVSRLITNRMEMSIMSVNGNTDKEYIASYVKNMPVRDSFMLRKYISENEPGIDWKFTVNRPESLGGGSFETFLNWDDSVFFNIAEG